jgi:hypothetical protein
MTKLRDWPFWLQMLVVTPHAVLIFSLVWLWWPKTNRQWYWYFGLLAYFGLFYVIFVR